MHVGTLHLICVEIVGLNCQVRNVSNMLSIHNYPWKTPPLRPLCLNMMTDGRAAIIAKHSEMARERFMRTLLLMHVWLDYHDVTVVVSSYFCSFVWENCSFHCMKKSKMKYVPILTFLAGSFERPVLYVSPFS